MDYKAEFIRIFSENVSRPGAQQLLDWLATTDFYTAPASTRFHGACECGLVMHSINVYNVLMSRFYTEEDNKESFTLVSLLHDLCKANYYKSGFRNVKNDATGQWEKVPSYSVQDAFPFGHGEKSVYLIERFIRLKPVEAIAIRWHMGGFDDAVRGGSYAISNAFDEYPLAVKLHLADLEATYLVEKGTVTKPIFSILPYRSKKVGIITTGSEVQKGLIKDTFTPVLKEKLDEFSCQILGQTLPGDERSQITSDILSFIDQGADMVICSGGMSVDPDDRTPGAIKDTGAEIVTYGAPVLPGAMLLLSYYQNNDKIIPILGLPGCVMYARRTVFDLILPRIMADDRICADEIASYGEGGLCLNCDVCTFPNCGFGK